MVAVAQYHGIGGTTAREIAASAEAAIRDGGLDTGAALPTVRGLAATLGTSPATVNAAYRILRERGLVVTAGRRGTHVAPRPALRTPRRAPDFPAPPDARDLTIGLADPELLPAIGPALARIDLERTLRFGALEAPDPRLLALAARWFERDGIDASAIAIVAGALDGIERVLQAHLRPGDRVVIEDPAYPAIRDIMLALGLMIVPVAVDDRGVEPGALEAALRTGADAAVIVPRAQNPFGAALDAGRAAELRAVLARAPKLLLIEDDHASIVAGAGHHRTIAPGWRRWAVIRTMSKIVHPDLRLAVMAGDETTIARVEGRQALGPRWVSHVLQALAAEILAAPAFPAVAARARTAYAARRGALLDALAARGIAAHGRSGLNVWVPVSEEAATIRALHDRGWTVLAGERFRIESPPGIRITTAALREDEAGELAEIIAATEQAGRPRRSY